MPSLKCTFREFIEIIEAHQFKFHRQDGTSHAQYKDPEGRLVTVAAHNLGDEVKIKTLESMIRQSGLSKKLFRK